MIEMRVSAEYPAQARADHAQQCLAVHSALRSRIDDGERLTPHDIGVGTGPRHHSRIGCGNPPHQLVHLYYLARDYLLSDIHDSPVKYGGLDTPAWIRRLGYDGSHQAFE